MSLKLISKPWIIPTAFIPVDPETRETFYRLANHVFCVELPTYETIKRKSNMNTEDLMVLLDDVTVKFIFNGSKYHISFYKGFVFDCASVPTSLVHGKLNKFGQHIELAAMVHDLLFNQQLVSFEDANDIFEGIIKEIGGCSTFTRKLYKMGVSSPIGRHLYKENAEFIDRSWMNGYYEFVKEPL